MLRTADVVVVGGGPAGSAAAVAAAREGKSVVVVEKTAQLGGAATLSGVGIFMIVGNFTGFYREVVRAIRPDFEASCDDPAKVKVLFDPQLLRLTLNRMLVEAGVDILFHADFLHIERDSDGISTVFVNTVEGIRAVRGRVVIDATGNGRVAIDAGAEYTSGRDEDGGVQPMSMIFQMQDTGHPVDAVLPEGCERYETVEDLPQGRVLRWEAKPMGTLLVNMTRVAGNGARIEDLNRAELESLRQVFSTANYLQRHGYESYVLSSIGSQVGVRESNQIRGLYTLTEEDLLAGRRFDDVVAQSNYNIDIHNPDGSGTTEERPIEMYDIPYRCMVPQGIDGMLVAGRALSSTHVAISSARVMPTCFALGQAAGTAAAIAIDAGTSLADVPAGELHDRLGRQGVEFAR